MSGEDYHEAVPGRIWAAGLLLALVALLTYAASLRGAWVYDDWSGIVQNPTIRHLGTAWHPPMDTGVPVAGRPLLNVSFALDYAISGLAPWSYHATNLLIHAAATLLLFGIVRRTVRPSRTEGAEAAVSRRIATPVLVAFAIALIWAVHPLGTEAVAYTVQRAESLMGLFYLLTVYAFIRGAQAGLAEVGGGGAHGWYALSVVACGCGMATKEVMVSAPLIVALYDRTFVAGTFTAAWRKRRAYYLSLAATWVVLATLVASAGTRGGTAGFTSTAPWWSYAAVQLRAQVWYLMLSGWPHPLVFDYGVGVLPLATSQLACAVVMTVLGGLVAIAVWRRTAAGWAGAFYFAVLAPTSTVLPIVTEPLAEHRMYLPLAAVIAVVVTMGVALAGRRFVVATLAAVVPLIGLTQGRERVYRSEQALWTDTVAGWPANARGHYNLGRVRSAAGDLRGAAAAYEAAIALYPNFPSAHSNLANVLLQLGDRSRAQAEAETAIRLNPRLPEAHNNLGNALFVSGNAAAARREYEAAVRLEPGNQEYRSNYATALVEVGQMAAALAEYEALVRENPRSALLHFNYANTLARSGRFHRAVAEYRQTLALDPKYPRAVENLSRAQALEPLER